MMREMVCINCPRGCRIRVDETTLAVSGNRCPRGKEYGIAEATHPTRTLTSTAKVTGGRIPRVSLKTARPIPKELLFPAMAEINRLALRAPIAVGQVLIADLLATGIPVVATKNVEEKP